MREPVFGKLFEYLKGNWERGAGSNRRPWGYEPQGRACTSFMQRKNPIKTRVAVRKMWLFASCDTCFDMNLGKISAKSRQNFSRQDEAMQQLTEGQI
jgi:hypothetical protein